MRAADMRAADMRLVGRLNAPASAPPRPTNAAVDPHELTQRLLTVPPKPRNFLISPPPSPPEEWQQTKEDGPNSVPYVDLTPTPMSLPKPTSSSSDYALLSESDAFPAIVVQAPRSPCR